MQDILIDQWPEEGDVDENVRLEDVGEEAMDSNEEEDNNKEHSDHTRPLLKTKPTNLKEDL